MTSTGSIYTLHEHLCLTILNRGRRLVPDDQSPIPHLLTGHASLDFEENLTNHEI